MSIEAIIKANRQGSVTQFTKRRVGLEKGTPEPSMRKCKPYRSAALKKRAREVAYLDAGTYVAPDAPRLWHKN